MAWMGSNRVRITATMKVFHLLVWLFVLPAAQKGSRTVLGEVIQEFEISEGVPIGTRIGFIGNQMSPTSAGSSVLTSSSPSYLIVPVPGSSVETDLTIDQSSGEIRTKVELDRETRDMYSLVAIPMNGANVRVIIRVRDVNDNAPEFPSAIEHVEFPENTPRDVKRTLQPARDKDLGVYNTQRYAISGGNVNNAFRLSSHRERDGILYLDLQVNGFLDRETTPQYNLLIEAFDGGNPQLKGSMTVHVTIQDVNDNSPTWSQSRYFATVSENTTIGTKVLQVFATDTDDGPNGRIFYSINRRQSDKESVFNIDKNSGVISINRPLDFKSKEIHELVVVARDNGAQPLETTVFVSIRVINIVANQPVISLVFLTHDGTPKVSEGAMPGEYVARVNVLEADSKQEHVSNMNVTLNGGQGHFELLTRNGVVYVVISSKQLDREVSSNYTLTVVASNQQATLNTSTTFHLQILDVNDNKPTFISEEFHASVLEIAQPGTSVIQVIANDVDLGNNSLVTYEMKSTPDTHSQWFQIDTNTGIITTKELIDCETDPMPRLTIIANDHGTPALSSSATVYVRVMNVQNEPIFDHSFYNVSVPENTPIGKCILKVDAMDPDCGVNAMVNYTIHESIGKPFPVSVNSRTGEICITENLDFEERSVYEVPVVATDTGGLSSTTMVKIHVTDLNDNAPKFATLKHNISLREGVVPKGPIVSVVATDLDSRRFGRVSYEIVKGNEGGKFRIDKMSGEIFVLRALSKSQPLHSLTISATDGAGLASETNAELILSVVDMKQQPPVFQHSRYAFSIDEDAPVNSVVGSVTASGGTRKVRYSISSGDPNTYFSIDTHSGEIKTVNPLDHEKHSSVLLSIQAMTNEPPAYGHCQVEIKIRDVNDWSPKFELSTVTIWVPENAEVGTVVYGVHANDMDGGENGRVRYSVVNESPASHFRLDSNEGHLALKAPLDYETVKRYTLIIGAQDHGSPPRLAPNLTLFVEVQDINDCEPRFEQENYVITVSEALPVNSSIIELNAVDEDTGNNARISYSLSNQSEYHDVFAIIPTTGVLYLRAPLDREMKDLYMLRVVATDHGSVPLSTTCLVTLRVSDENDNGPEFVKKQYQFSVEESNEPGASVGAVTAHDKDEGENAHIRYYLQPSHTHFQIDPNSGIISATSSLDAEKHSRYELQVIAVDQGNDSKQAEVIIQIDVLPRHNRTSSSSSPSSKSQCQGQDCHLTSSKSKFHFKVFENATIGHLVGTVTYSTDEKNSVEYGDYEDGSLVTYAIIGGNTAFEINKSSGGIFVAQTLNYEVTSHYVLQIRAVDDSMLSPQIRVITVDVDLVDVNDERPRFVTSDGDDPITISIPENARVGSVVWNFTAIDLDDGLNGVVHYNILKQRKETDSQEKFRINVLSGVLYLNSELDYEQQESYIIVLSATDQALNVDERLFTTVTVHVQIEDQNDHAPKFISSPQIHIWENEPLHSIVHRVVATDADSGENGRVTYRITSGNEDDYFSLNETNGQLSLVNSLGKGIELTHFALNISATDHGFPPNSAFQVLQVMVQELYTSRPQFLEEKYEARIQENSLIGTEVLRITAFRRNQSSNNNSRLVYKIPDGMGDGKFAIHSTTGSVTVAGLIDREVQSEYSLTIYVYDESFKSLYDTATLLIKIIDLNDEHPNFKDTCSDLRVPENHELGVIHTFKAWDLDLGRNGEVTYSIVSGNPDNMFSIDFHSGKFTSRPLDREKKAQYQLLIAAQDQGLPVQRTTCNLTVFVEDENDNTPSFLVENQFNQPQYMASIPENVPVGTTVLVVEAKDADIGINAIIKYSLSNESHWHFTIDNATGAIITTGPLDREKISEYSFEVVATDSGLYDSRSSKAQVKVILTDVNTQKPHFSQNPIIVEVSPQTKPGQNILQLKATDSDEGANSILTYSIENRESRFRIQPQTGIIAPVVSLMPDRGKVFHLMVVARDQGTPSLSSTALVVIQVGELSLANTLQFQESFYEGRVSENARPGTDVLQVTALKKDGRLHRTTYSIVVGNEDNAFEIVAATGQIRVGDKIVLDRERLGKYSLVVSAKTETPTALYATAVVNITLIDENDNSAVFNQNTYSAAVWEGNNKGTFVTQVMAHDDDEGPNANLIYHIVDGNHDNAFIIEPLFSGIVKTNIVLDREIRDNYRLTIIATDEGSPQMSGTCLLYINVIDVNDNSPAFSPTSVVNIFENIPVGFLVTTVVANDVDTNPALVYTFTESGNPNGVFSIGKYTGAITLAAPIDYEEEKSYKVQIQVSDSVHSAFSTLEFNVLDANDHAPVFEKSIYHVTLSDDVKPGSQVFQVRATDKDSRQNGRVKYSFQKPRSPGYRIGRSSFWIDENTGIIYTNETLAGANKDHSISEITVVATDLGRPSRQSKATLRIEVNPSEAELIRFTSNKYATEINSQAHPGTSVIKLAVEHDNHQMKTLHYHFAIVSGNLNGYFSIGSHSGEISLLKPLGHEPRNSFQLIVSVECIDGAKCSSSTEVHIREQDQSKHNLQFNETEYRISVSETKPIGATLFKLDAADLDSKTSTIQFDITSGNDDDKFNINPKTGVLVLKQPLDYDHVSSYKLVIRAQDKKLKSAGILAVVHVDIEDENEHAPMFILQGQNQFPYPQYLEFVGENEPIGTAVFVARAIDMDKGIYGRLNYSIVEHDMKDKFHIHPTTGLVATRILFDYELRNRYYFSIRATDIGGLSSTVRVQVDIESRDEFVPQFTEKLYKFVVPVNAGSGYVIGYVEATDRDQGADGRVLYQLHQPNAFIRVNRTSGALIMKQLVASDVNGSFIVIANSGRSGSKSARTFAEISIGDYSAELEMATTSNLTSWVIGLLIASLVLVLLCSAVFVVLRLKQKKQKKDDKTDNFNNCGFDTLEYAQSAMLANNSRSTSLYSPQYSDLADIAAKQRQRVNNTVSELSDQSHSASSGRGSAEDGEEVEDEEIRMITEGTLAHQQLRDSVGIPDSGIHGEDDAASHSSAKNTQEYLARLGIVPKINTEHQSYAHSDWNSGAGHDVLDSIRSFESARRQSTDNLDISTLIYSQIPEDVNTNSLSQPREPLHSSSHHPSMNGSVASGVHSEEEVAGSYKWDYLLDWGPQYQPLAQVFSEIARLKEDASNKSETHYSGLVGRRSSPGSQSSNHSRQLLGPAHIRTSSTKFSNSSNSNANRIPHHNINPRPGPLPPLPIKPRSPISHDCTFTSGPMSPTFTPTLSPLANRSPTMSPVGVVGPSNIRTSQLQQNFNSDSEMRI